MPANQYSDSLLMDALRGSLSNAESLGRGFAVAPVGLLGDVNALARQYVTPRLPQSVQGLLQSAPAAPTTEQILSNIPRVSNPRMETAGMEQLGAAMNPRGPVDLARGVGRVAGNAINEAMVYDRGLLAGITPQPMRMDVYHGSPYKFDKFDSSKIGTGEGAQAYGYGHYFSDNPDVAEGFKKAGDIGFAEREADNLMYWKKNIDDAIAQAEKELSYVTSNKAPKSTIDEVNATLAVLQNRKSGRDDFGNLYKIDLPDEQVAKMLDFDKPLMEQTPEVKALANQYGLTDSDHLGGDLVAAMRGKTPAGAESMRKAGLTGIRYLDQATRGVKEGTSNFVVFPQNEGLLTIKEINDQPVQNLLGR